MTDRHFGYIVVLEQEIREDDAEPILAALRMIKGVLSVEPVIGAMEVHIAQARERTRLREKLYKFVESLNK